MPGIKGRHLTEKGLFVKMNDLIIKKKKKAEHYYLSTQVTGQWNNAV